VLGKEALAKIVDTQVAEVMKRLTQKRIALAIEPEVHAWLADKGYNPQYGARPLRRTIQDKILTPIASLMIAQGVMEGGTVTVSIRNDEPYFDVKKKAIRNSAKNGAKKEAAVA